MLAGYIIFDILEWLESFLYHFVKLDIFFYIILSILYLCVIAVICMVKKN